jgi:SEC-C motif
MMFLKNFLEKVEPYLLSENHIVRKSVVQLLKDTTLPTEETLFTALKAIDREGDVDPSESILPHVDFLPMSEKGFVEILNRVKALPKTDQRILFYMRFIRKAETELLAEYKDRVSSFFGEEELAEIVKMPCRSRDELMQEFDEVVEALEKDWFNQSYYNYGKRVIKELVNKGGLDVKEIEKGITECVDEKGFLAYRGILLMYMAGEMQIETLVPRMVDLFRNEEEGDVALNELADVLIRIGTPEVVEEVEKVALIESTFYFSIKVLESIKTKEAEEALLRLFNKAADLTQKTLLAEALSQHLSVESIPLVERLIEEGYDEMMLSLEESLYTNCIINNIEHPKLGEWKDHLVAERQHQQSLGPIPPFKQPVVNDEKVGRNDPCPCGSGKKYKKCCLN